jgi:hypothetical protein
MHIDRDYGDTFDIVMTLQLKDYTISRASVPYLWGKVGTSEVMSLA